MSVDVKVEQITGLDLVRKACEATMRGQSSKASLDKMYRCEHSPIRCSTFWIEMIGVPTFCSVHFVRHKIGVEHFVMSNRDDRGGTGKEDRNTPVNHSMFINAAELIQMSRKRLCGSTHETTRLWMQGIVDGVQRCDPDLSKYMVRECQYRNGICPEIKCCGNLYKG